MIAQRFRPRRAALAALTSAVLLVACGGIEGTGSPMAAIEGTGVSTGGVTGFGSVFVNGVRYSTDRADIVVDGVPASEAALRVGMVVQVIGDVDSDGRSGTARRVEFDQPLFGPIDSIDRHTRQIVVLGQLVRLDDATLFGEGSEDALQEGQLCMTSGYPEAGGQWLASLLQCDDGYEAGSTVVEVEGLVSALDTNTGSFRLGGLSVAMAGATLDSAQGMLANGALVEVIGRQPQRGGVLNAERIRVRAVNFAPTQSITLEGVIGRFAGLSDFDVGRQRINAASAQRGDDFDLAPASGVRIRLQGSVGADGVIVAARYALEPVTDALFTGRVDAVDAASERLTLLGDARQAGLTTQYEDRRSVDSQRRFRIQDLQAGDYIQVRGFRDAQGRAVVTRVERRDEEEPQSGTVVARFRVEVGSTDPALTQARGVLDSFDTLQSSLVVAGVAVTTDAARTEFFDRNGNSTTAPLFYNDLRTGDRLEAEGSESSDTILATRVWHRR